MSHITEAPAVREGTAYGLQWKILLSPLQINLNGYVRLPSSHVWFLLDYDGIPALVHGGLTYGPDDDGWIGFDTAHFGDYWSDAEIATIGGDTESIYPRDIIGGDRKYRRDWTVEKMVAETESLARQAAAIEVGLDNTPFEAPD